MKNLIKIAACCLAIAGMSSSCSEDKILNVDVHDVPTVTEYVPNFSVTVDQSTNIATFTFNGKGVYPVWIIDGKTYSTAHSFTKYYRKAGDYTVDVMVGNSNGVSLGAETITFHIDKTAMSGFGGFDYESDFNLWTKANKKINSFFYAPGWAQIADPEHTFTGDTFTVKLPAATTDQWQAQIHIGTDICLQQGESYDGSFIYTSNVDIAQAVLKIHPDGDDDDSHSFFPAQKIKLTAGEPTTFWFSNLPATIDMNNLVFTLDFGGNPENAEIIIENFVLKNHKDDDGTVLPEVPAIPEPDWAAWNSADNFLMNPAPTVGFYYAPGWAQLPDPALTVADGKYSIVLPSATFEMWQAQMSFSTEFAVPDANTEYDFHIAFESNVDMNATVKLTDGTNDNNFFFAETAKLVAGGKSTFWQAKIKAPAAMPSVKLVLDFGGNPDNTEVTISEIVLQKHRD